MSEATASATVSCMFRILSTHLYEAVLGPATQIVEKAQAIRSNALNTALYDGAKFLVENGSKISTVDVVGVEVSVGEKTSSVSDAALATGQRFSAQEGFEIGAGNVSARFQPLVMAVLACPVEPWRQPERVRKSRLELALALAQGALQDPAALAAILDPWLVEERSRPLREDIERARQACKRN